MTAWILNNENFNTEVIEQNINFLSLYFVFIWKSLKHFTE